MPETACHHAAGLVQSGRSYMGIEAESGHRTLPPPGALRAINPQTVRLLGKLKHVAVKGTYNSRQLRLQHQNSVSIGVGAQNLVRGQLPPLWGGGGRSVGWHRKKNGMIKVAGK